VVVLEVAEAVPILEDVAILEDLEEVVPGSKGIAAVTDSAEVVPVSEEVTIVPDSADIAHSPGDDETMSDSVEHILILEFFSVLEVMTALDSAEAIHVSAEITIISDSADVTPAPEGVDGVPDSAEVIFVMEAVVTSDPMEERRELERIRREKVYIRSCSRNRIRESRRNRGPN
jgi:hypothetical protein